MPKKFRIFAGRSISGTFPRNSMFRNENRCMKYSEHKYETIPEIFAVLAVGEKRTSLTTVAVKNPVQQRSNIILIKV